MKSKLSEISKTALGLAAVRDKVMIQTQKIVNFLKEKTVSLTGILIEGILFFSVITFLFFIMLQEDGWYLQMNIHPLLVITVYFGIRHGFIVSLIVSFVSVLHYFFCYMYLGLDPLVFFTDFQYGKFPLMFLAGGYISGKISHSFNKKLKNFREANIQMIKSYDELQESYEKAAKLVAELKEEIVGSEKSIFSLYEIAQSLQTFNPERIYTESIGLLYKFIKARGISIYKLSDNGYLRLKIRYGSDNTVNSVRSYLENNTYRKVVKQKKAFRWQGDADTNSPVFSGPIMHEQKVIGIIDIDSIGFEYVTEYSFSIFQVISDWISKALYQALEIDSKLYPKNSRGATILELSRYYEQLDEEKKRKQKYDLSYCEVIYSTAGNDSGKLMEIISSTLRDVDYIFFSKEDQTIRLLLPATKEDDYQFVEQRIFSNINGELRQIT